MPGGRAAAAAIALLLGPGCTFLGSGSGRPPPDPAVTIWLPAVIYWDADRREVSLDLENHTTRAVRVEAPGARRVRAALFFGSGPDRACGMDPDPTRTPGPAVELGPGDAVAVTVDLAPACGRLPPGQYRYEIAYDAPAVEGGPPMRLLTRHGFVEIGAAPAPERGSLGSGGASRH